MLFTKMAPNAWRALVAVLLAAGYAALASSATTHTVGGVHSWMTGVDYAAWASDKTFAVGDQLLFSYVRTDHTVTEVSRSGYDACSAGGDARSEDNKSGLTTVTLATPGAHYFICVVPNHCASGMRLAVNVSAAPASGAAATTSGAAGGAMQVPVAVPVVAAAAAATGALIKLALL
ncbi:blue copper protein-like [Panicum virgatum]|nr:blue copper protein-like [Panicum virgatum]